MTLFSSLAGPSQSQGRTKLRPARLFFALLPGSRWIDHHGTTAFSAAAREPFSGTKKPRRTRKCSKQGRKRHSSPVDRSPRNYLTFSVAIWGPSSGHKRSSQLGPESPKEHEKEANKAGFCTPPRWIDHHGTTALFVAQSIHPGGATNPEAQQPNPPSVCQHEKKQK